MLTALELVEVQSNTKGVGTSFWKFRCDCGEVKILRASHVTGGKTKSCGCLMRKNEVLSFQKDLYRNHLSSLKRRSRKGKVLRVLDNELSFDDYVALCSQLCVYCGKIDERKYLVTGVTIKFNGIDRIDQLGYLKSNCQPCCGRHNRAKGAYSHTDYMEDIKLQYDYLFGG
jgi:hypothetical protein